MYKYKIKQSFFTFPINKNVTTALMGKTYNQCQVHVDGGSNTCVFTQEDMEVGYHAV